MRNAWLVSMTLLAGAVPVFADQGAVVPPSTPRFGSLRAPQRADPYANLFNAREALRQAVQQEAAKRSLPKTKIVCGMTVVEADPSIDPKIGVTLPKGDNVRHTIRAIEPPICR